MESRLHSLGFLNHRNFSPDFNLIRIFILSLVDQRATDHATNQVTDHVKSLLKVFETDSEEMALEELLHRLRLRHKPSFRQNYLRPALETSLIEMTYPGSPRSPRQRYRLTEAGQRFKRSLSSKP